MPSFNVSMRKSFTTIITVMFCCSTSIAWADHVDVAPMADEVIKSLVDGRLSAPDSLPEVLSARLDEASVLLSDVEHTVSSSTGRERESALEAKRMLLSAKRAELDGVHAAVSARLAASRIQLEKLGLKDRLNSWDDLTSQVENRFNRVGNAL